MIDKLLLRSRVAGLLFVVATALLPGTASADEDPLRQWRVLYSETVTTNENYGLVNLRRAALYRESQLGYLKNESKGGMASVFGVDFESTGWRGASGGYFVFQLPKPDNVRDHRKTKTIHDPRKLDINDTMTLAIYNTSAKKYLVGPYRWSSTPSYEWVVRRRAGADFALYNTRERAYLVLNESNQEALTFKSQ
jgi:hypothetical protein